MPSVPPSAPAKREVDGDPDSIDFTPQTEVARLDQLSPRTHRRHQQHGADQPTAR